MISNLAAERPPIGRALTLAAIMISLLPASLSSAQFAEAPQHDNTLVNRALAAELRAAQDSSHPMKYQLRKSTPRLTTAKEIVETDDGAVARLLTVNDAVPSPADRQKDDARLDALLADPSRQQKRKQSELNDSARILKVLRALPKAFLYRYSGSVADGSGTIEHYTFTPNPKFNSSDLELLVLTAMTGELTVDSAHERVIRLEGHLQQDVDIGWGLLGRLYKGGSIVIEQADIGEGQWRIVHFQMEMNGRVLFKTRRFDTTEEESRFAPVPAGMTYQQAIQMLRSGENNGSVVGRLK